MIAKATVLACLFGLAVAGPQYSGYPSLVYPTFPPLYGYSAPVVSNTILEAPTVYSAPEATSYAPSMSYSAPVVSPYSQSFPTPAIRSSVAPTYSTSPVPKSYSTPAVSSYSYSVPHVQSYSYSAPVVKPYSVPSIRSYSQSAPLVRSYTTPISHTTYTPYTPTGLGISNYLR